MIMFRDSERTPAGHAPGRRVRTLHDDGDRPDSLFVAAVIALIAGLLMGFTPVTRTDDVTWGFDWDVEPIDTAKPFRFDVFIDTTADLIESSIDGLADLHGSVSGLDFTLLGNSGDGLVSIEARDPLGGVVVRDLVGPDHYFQYPPDPLQAHSWLRVTATAHPAGVPEPGGDVVITVDIDNPAANLGPATVARILAEPFAPENVANLDAPAPSGPHLACAALSLPMTLDRGHHVTCELQVRLEGRRGTNEEVVIGVMTDDLDSGVWSTEPLNIEIVAPDVSIPPPPPTVPPQPPVARPDPVIAGISTDVPGRYGARIDAPEGSAGFRLSLQAARSARTWPWSEAGPGFPLGLALLAAGSVVFVVRRRPAWRRAGGAMLVCVGLAVPVLLAMTEDHSWYWRPYSHLAWIAALALPFFGMSALAAASRPNRLRRIWRAAGWLIGTLAGLVVFVAAISSYAYGASWTGGDFPGSYNGDYMGMGIHVVATQVAAPLLALTAALFASGGPVAAHRLREEE